MERIPIRPMMSTLQKNPYIGPRTFLKEERHLFFGRDRESRDLAALVASDKLVLFYAQSGAGKSSLINTSLIPDLEDKLYEVLPVVRVSGNWPEGSRAENIFVYDLMRSLIQREMDASTLLNLPLYQFLARLNEDENGYFYDTSLTTDIRKSGDFIPWRRALIIDQFEELFSTHPEAWQKREDFFRQLAQAMEEDPYLWVVLVMREDFIAALDPYAHILPGGLRTRYYMQRLSREAATSAVRKPVENLRPYEPGVAEKLVDDLSRIKVQRPDGTPDIQPGQYVEPVQLQVVCYSLWENLPPRGSTITERDLLEVGDVDEALGKYYAGRIEAVAQTSGVKERLIRDWIERKLIAPGGIRSMVMQETGKRSGGIGDEIIRMLQSDLVRAENRGGTVWYELTHDRLVGPIQDNNRKWFDVNLSPLQRQAAIWNDQDRNESWLLRDQALAEVEDWARANPEELGELENEFLEACREQQEQIKLNEQVRSAQRLRRFLVIVGAVGLIAIVAAVLASVFAVQASRATINANQQAATARAAEAVAKDQRATAQVASGLAETRRIEAVNANATAQAGKDQALSGSLVAQADSLKNTNYPLALLTGIEAYARDDSLLTRTTLFHLLQFTPYQRFPGFVGPVSSVAVSPDGAVIAVASCSDPSCSRGGITLYDSNMQEQSELPAARFDFGAVYALAFHPNENILAAGGCMYENQVGCRGQITFWDINDVKNPLPLSDTNTSTVQDGIRHSGLVKTIAFNQEGNQLASGSYDTTIIIWDVSNPRMPFPRGKPLTGRNGHTSFVNSVAFTPDSSGLISAGDDRSLRLWDLQNPDASPRIHQEYHTTPINSIAFSPDGTKFASAGDDNLILLWDWTSGDDPLENEPTALRGHTGYVRSIAFAEDGARTILASTGFDNKIILWDTSAKEQIGPALSVHTAAVNSLDFGSKELDGEGSLYLISGSGDRSVIRWDVSARQPLSYTDASPAEQSTEQLSDANSQYEASVNLANNQQVDLRYLDSPDIFLTLDEFDSPVQFVGFEEQNGQALVTIDKTIDENEDSIGRMTRWQIDPTEWVELACEAVSRNLTPELWSEFLQLLDEPSPKQSCVTSP
jgi:WD40 repeat protein